MKEFLFKLVYLHFNVNNHNFYYLAATITNITETHISFIDEYNKPYIYRIDDLVKIELSKNGEKNK